MRRRFGIRRWRSRSRLVVRCCPCIDLICGEAWSRDGDMVKAFPWSLGIWDWFGLGCVGWVELCMSILSPTHDLAFSSCPQICQFSLHVSSASSPSLLATLSQASSLPRDPTPSQRHIEMFHEDNSDVQLNCYRGASTRVIHSRRECTE